MQGGTILLAFVAFLGLVSISTVIEGASGPYRCYDEERNCPGWAERGDCRTNPGWMSINCEKSCNLCDKCADQSRNCPKWAERGDCQANFVWMMRHCKLSCKLCSN